MTKTLNEVQQAVVKIITTDSVASRKPWEGKRLQSSSGSGFVLKELSGNNKIGIVTNSHVLGRDTVEINLKFPHISDPIKNVKVVYRNDAHDLAFLVVEDEKLAEKVSYLQIADNEPEISDQVTTLGFPAGGETICFTQGALSRIGVQDVTRVGVEHLVLQTDAAINPGSSGGPVLRSKTPTESGRVVGVAFAGTTMANNIGYAVPGSLLKRHVKSYKQSKKSGVPEVTFQWTPIISEKARDLHGLQKGQSGILVLDVDKASVAYGKLRKGDVILAVDGHQVCNDGTYQYTKDSINKVKFTNIIAHKHLGDLCRFKVLRRNEDKKGFTVHEEQILLNNKVGHSDRNVTPIFRFSEKPSYMLYHGIAFKKIGSDFRWNFEQAANIKGIMERDSQQGKDCITIILDTILPSKHYNQNYDNFSLIKKPVKAVDGRFIANWSDLADAFSTPKFNDHHVITFLDNTEMEIPQLTPSEEARVYSKNNIPLNSLYSKDIQSLLSEKSLQSYDAVKQNMTYLFKIEGMLMSVEKQVDSLHAQLEALCVHPGAQSPAAQDLLKQVATDLDACDATILAAIEESQISPLAQVYSLAQHYQQEWGKFKQNILTNLQAVQKIIKEASIAQNPKGMLYLKQAAQVEQSKQEKEPTVSPATLHL